MPIINVQLFSESTTLRVRDVPLSAADDLQTHREKLARIVLDEMYQFVGLLDVDGNTLEINRAALEGAGIRLDDVQGKPFWEARWWAVSRATQECQRDLVRRARQGEFVRRDMEIYGQAAGEETIIIDYSLSPVKDANGRIVFLLAEGRNITEKSQAEAEIARKNDELERLVERIQRLDQLKTDFFANVSHELRTPLALILGPAESILATGNNLSERQRRDLAVIHRNAATLLKHVNDMLDLAKLDAGKQTVHYTRIDLARETRTVAAHFDSLALDRSVSYVISTPEILEGEVDPEKFDRILLNLLSNAFKFTPARGRIRCVIQANGSDRALLSVQDSGPGIHAERRDAIFERFRQEPNETVGQFGGTGLGLAIAKDFVDLHGGHITFSDAPGGGTLFQVELPLRAPTGARVRCHEAMSVAKSTDVLGTLEELQPIEVDRGADKAAGGRPVILVAEDNADMRRFISDVLSDEYRVVPCSDGAEALERAIADPPDLVVTDLMMPKLEGDRLVVKMRAREPLAQVPVLVVSARADEALRVKLLGESVQDYVIKPFLAEELRARVRNLVMMKRSRDLLQKELASQNENLAELTQQLVTSRQELQRNIEALRASEGRWRAIFENSAVGIALTNAEGFFSGTNRAYQEMVGYSDGELRALSYVDITYEEDRQANQVLATALWEGKLQQFKHEKRYRRKDGKLIWVRNTVSLAPGTETVPRFGLTIVEDITERKEAEERLREYEKVVEGLEEMIVVIDREYRYRIANRAFLTYRGLNREQLIGHSIPELLNKEALTVTKEKLDECFKGKVVKYELRYNYPTLGERNLFISYFPVEGAGGVDRAACVLQDITESKRTEEKLQNSLAQLRALAARLQSVREEERTRVAREIHDELGQALTAIKIDLASLMQELPRDLRQPRDRIQSLLKIADETIQSVRKISTELRPGILDDLGLVAAVEWAAEEFQARTGVKCRLSLPDFDIAMDPERTTALFRIFQETLTNIMRHANATEVDVRLSKDNGDLSLEIRDNGKGIGEEQLAAGRSLGILGMRERALVFGGELTIRGAPGQGTAVKVRIPKAARHELERSE
jgi:PAS domain S-box-containing protein